MRHVQNGADVSGLVLPQEVEKTDCAADKKSVVVLNADGDTVALEQRHEVIELALIPLDRRG